MSYLVLHMDKFKKDAVRANYELHESSSANYAEAIQNRIDDLLLVKAVRKDAVRMCGLIVTSDSAFFQELSPEDTRRFFE